MDGHRVRARDAPQQALSSDGVGRVTSEAALSKLPKGPGSRPITPQDEVFENDRQFKFGKLGGAGATMPEIWRAALAA